MIKTKINMVGGGFQHEICSSAGSIPKYVEWDKRGGADISIHIDHAIIQPINKTKKNYAWICESSAIIPDVIQWISHNISYIENNFELIFTHDKRLISLSNKMKLILPNAVPWVTDRGVHKKTKLISMIASLKRYCAGHHYRQEILQKYKDKIDCFGTGHNRINKKEEGLNTYCFSIAMENDNYPNAFCEKITDCFATGTIPIYWGTPTIGEFFNENGIILLTNDFNVDDLSVDLYDSKMEFILDNYERSINLPTAEDYMFENFIK
jgi:hypothetical protein